MTEDRETITAWKRRVAIAAPADMVDVLARSGSYFTAAARLKVFEKDVHAALTMPESRATLKTVRDYAKSQVIAKAGSADNQANVPTANLRDLSVLAAWAKVFEMLEGQSAELGPIDLDDDRPL